jgi:hypothetical protein
MSKSGISGQPRCDSNFGQNFLRGSIWANPVAFWPFSGPFPPENGLKVPGFGLINQYGMTTLWHTL